MNEVELLRREYPEKAEAVQKDTAVEYFALDITTAGALKVDFANGATVTLPNVPVGRWKGKITKVYTTGTAAVIGAAYFD